MAVSVARARLGHALDWFQQMKLPIACQLLFCRSNRNDEVELATLFLESGKDDGDKISRWEQRSLALLSSNEFLFVD